MAALLLEITPASAARLVLELDPAAAPGARSGVLARLSSGAGAAVRITPMFAGHTASDDPLARFYIAETPDDAAAAALLRAAKSDAAIRSAEPDVVLPLEGGVPNDPFFSHSVPDSMQWPLHANPLGPDLDVLEAWNVTRGDPSIVIAVLDSGIEWRHPEFGSPLSADGAIWRNVAEVNGTPGVDDDGNGFVDDVRGWDFVDVSMINYESSRVDPLEDGFLADNDPIDFDGHGTIVSGIIGARADDGIGMAGVAPGCRLMPVRVGWHENYLDNLNRRIMGGVVAMSFCAQAIVYAADNGARVLNCSWLSDQTAALTEALDYAIIDRGVVVVDAAGNGGTSETQSRNYLSRRGDCIEVAALRKNSGISAVTSLGNWIEVAAPGEQLLSLTPITRNPPYTITTQGATSFAAPFVTAVAALALSAAPGLTPPQVRQLLRETATNIDDVNFFWLGKFGAGMINAGAVVARLNGIDRLDLPRPPLTAPAVLVDGTFLAIDAAANLISIPAGDSPDSTALPFADPVGPLAAFESIVGNIYAAASRSGRLVVMDRPGRPIPGWPRPTGGFLFCGPVLADLDNDVYTEVIQAGTDSLLYAWDLEGRRFGGYPVRLSDAAVAGPAAGDLDGDGKSEIVVATLDGRVHAFDRQGNALSGWPVGPISGVGSGAPILCDLDGDRTLEVVIAGGSVVHAFDRFGDPLPGGWPGGGPGPICFELAAADFDGDGRASVIAAEAGGLVHVLESDGFERSGWPVDLGAPIESDPIVMSLDGGREPAVVVVTEGRCVEALSSSGVRLDGWPYAVDGPVAIPAGAIGTAGAALWLYGEDRVARRIDLAVPPATRRGWYCLGGDPARRRALPVRPVPVGETESGQARIDVRVTPNPSTTGRATFHFRLEKSSPGALVLYDVQGRPVRRLFDDVWPAGETTLAWDGRDDLGRPLASGIYSYRFTAAGTRNSGRFVRLK